MKIVENVKVLFLNKSDLKIGIYQYLVDGTFKDSLPIINIKDFIQETQENFLVAHVVIFQDDYLGSVVLKNRFL